MNTITFEKSKTFSFFNVLKFLEPAISEDDSRKILSNIYVRNFGDNLEIGSTDGKRLHFARFNSNIWPLSLPKPEGSEKHTYKAIYGKTITIIKQEELNFPNIEQVMPRNYKQSYQIKYTEVLQIPTIYKVLSDGNIYVNDEYLRDILKHINTEIRIRHNDPASPVLFDTERSGFKLHAIIMPIRVSAAEIEIIKHSSATPLDITGNEGLEEIQPAPVTALPVEIPTTRAIIISSSQVQVQAAPVAVQEVAKVQEVKPAKIQDPTEPAESLEYFNTIKFFRAA